MRLSMLMACALAVGVGCGGPPFEVTDSFTPPPEGLFAQREDALHDYAVGSGFFVDVRAARWGVDLDDVEVVSKDPDILTITKQERVEDALRVHVRARDEGTAALAFLDKDHRPMEERVVEVKRPDEIVLSVNIDGDHGFTIPNVKKDALLVAEGGQVTFRVSYQRDGAPLAGVGILSGESDVLGVVNPTREGPHREFLTLQAPAAPTPAVPVLLRADGVVVRALEVRTASLDEIKSIELDEGEPGAKWNGTVYPVWAKAFDGKAKPIFGAPFTWDVGGTELDGQGDLLLYEHEGGVRTRVQVSAGDEVEQITVEAKKGSAEVKSTVDPGCAGALPGSLVALAVLLRARARRIAP